MATWTCAACGGDNAQGTKFCGHCGAQAATTWACPACGEENPAGMRFCGHCGAPATATPDAAPAVPATTAAPAAPSQAEQDVGEALRSFVAGQVAERLIEEGGDIPEERRLITALFADVSGFTPLADRLDPEQLLEVIDPVIAGLSRIVARYEGYVDKFAGDALLALFGAPVTHEDDAARALMVALEMHAEVERLCSELPHEPELTLHVGVNSGHGIARVLGSEARMDYSVLGDSVILAQRLESAAPPGETYVSEMSMRLAQDRFEFESVGELTLKGKAEPVPAWRLLGERVEVGPRDRAASPLIGREAELAQAASSIAGLATGTGAVLTVTGEAGVGKSRLTAQVREQAIAESCRWLETRCLSYGGSHAYWPYGELLRGFAGIDVRDGLPEAAGKLASALADVGVPEVLPFFARLLGLPAEGDEVASLEPEAFRRGLHEAFGTWARALARDRPLIVAIEDIHWGDSSTVALTTELARLCGNEPFMLYLIARPEAQAILGEIAPLQRAITLEPLGEEAATTLIEAVLGGRAPRELTEVVVGRTAGNPFFVEELIRSLLDGEVLTRDDGHWRIQPGWDARAVPPTIEGVLAARIDLLDSSAASVLQTASVIGRHVRIPLLTAVADQPSVEAALPRLVAGGFLDEADADGEATLVFHHALVQDVAYSRLLRRRSRDLHRRVAEEAEQLYGAGDDVVDLLARHLYLGKAGAKAIDYLIRAGERAKRLFANEEAILHLARSVEVALGDAELAERVPEIKLSLADLYELVGNYDDALALYTDVKEEANSIDAWRGIASTLRKRGEYERALAVVDAAFATDALRDADLTPLWLEQAWVLSVVGRFEQASDVAQAGLTTAGDRRDAVVAQLLLQLTRADTILGDFDSALEHGLAALSIFEEGEDLRGLVTAFRIVGHTYAQAERLDEAVDALRRGLELAERVGAAEEIGGCLINLGLVEQQRGYVTEAIAHDRRAVEEFERIGHGSGKARSYTNLADKLARTGEFDEALAWADKALDVSTSIGHSLTIADVYDTMAFIRLESGDFPGAAARAEEAASLYLEMGAAPKAAKTLAIAAEAWEKDGQDERAREVRSRTRNLVSS
jgi:class 3 adenylate cyclase/tetratricopeptide (TPR) repeat protein